MSEQLETERIHQAIRSKYAQVADSAEKVFAYTTGRAGAEALGYLPDELDGCPASMLRSFCGVGNPLALGPLSKDEAVLDVGCGAGLDLLLASQRVGPTGRACGIDLTSEMVAKAKASMAAAGLSHVEVVMGSAEAIPFPDQSFDLVISNGVLNLSVDKPRAFAELFRVLRPGGRLQFADIISLVPRTEDACPTLEAWSDWIGGALPVGELMQMLAAAGFHQVTHLGSTDAATSKKTRGAAFRARRP